MTATSDATVAPHLRRDFGRRALLFLSIGAMIGSGWLFAGLDAARPSGGSSLLAWLIAAGLVLTLALVHAELGTTFPVDGGSARFPLYAFGRVTGFVSGWFAWVAAACVAPIETEAALRYAGNYLPWLTTLEGHEVVLSAAGAGVAAVVLLGFTLLNLMGLKGFRETNSVVVAGKIALPIFVAFALIAVNFHPGNFRTGGFFSGGADGVLAAVSTGGVIFALIGFEQAVELGGETEDPQRSIPWAVIGAVIIGAAIYLLLQVAFVGSMPQAFLAHGWGKVHFEGIFGPYAGLATALGAGVATYLIYTAAIISPAGTGLTYSATASRIPFAMAREGYLPPIFARLSGRNVPLVALGVSYVAELAVIATFRNWDHLLRFVTSAVVLVYAFAPVSLAVLRRTARELPRPYRLPGAPFVARVAFCAANLVVIWNGWANDRILFGVVAGGMALYSALAGLRPQFRHLGHEWLAAAWLVPYTIGMATVSGVSPYAGGWGLIPSWASVVVTCVFSLAVYELALHLGARGHRGLPTGEQPLDRWRLTATLLESAES